MNLDELRQRVDKNTQGLESLSEELNELETKLQDSNVWSNQKLATEIGQQVREIKDKINLFSSWKTILEDAQTALEIGDEAMWDKLHEADPSCENLEGNILVVADADTHEEYYC